MNLELTEELKNIIDSSTADIYVYIGGIDSNLQTLRDLIRMHPNKKEEADLFLITLGGDPDWAYRLVSIIKMHYNKFNVIVPSFCKSAGTLIALGANTLRFHEYGELGPLDVQMTRKDDLFRLNSGLDVFQAISIINSSACSCFHNMFAEFLAKGRGSISTETASKIAKDMAIGIYSSIASKIDPVELGEKNRAMNIAKTYGNYLGISNAKEGTLDMLVGNYPSHSFVIDFLQAQKLFNRVDKMTDNDYKIYNIISTFIKGFNSDTLFIHDLTELLHKLQQAERTQKDETEISSTTSSASCASCLSPKPKTTNKSKPKAKSN